MKKYLIFLLFSLTIMSISAQRAENIKKTIEINDILSPQQFNSIRDYIFKSGNEQEYCKQSGSVPHLEIKNTDINLYLISFSTNKTLKASEYNVIYLVTNFNGVPFNYYLYITDKELVYLYDYKNALRNEEITNAAIEKLKNKISETLIYVSKP